MLKLYIGNKNYSSWSMRPWVLLKQAGIPFAEVKVRLDSFDAGSAFKQALQGISPTGRVPVLVDGGFSVWDTLAIAEYLSEVLPDAGLLPAQRAARAHCRAVSGEMHSGFSNLRSALPMNLKAHHPGFKVWAGAQADIDRIVSIWRECLAAYQGPFLFVAEPCMADAMFALVVTRFLTYDVTLDSDCKAYCEAVMDMPAMQEWIGAAQAEPDEVVELDVEF